MLMVLCILENFDTTVFKDNAVYRDRSYDNHGMFVYIAWAPSQYKDRLS